MAKRLYVGNLPYSLSEADLRDVFTEVGEVADVKLVLDRDTGRPRGFGFVEMATEADASQAIQALNGRELQGRPMSIREAQPRTGGFRQFGGGRDGGGGGGGGGWQPSGGEGRGGGGGWERGDRDRDRDRGRGRRGERW
jgi:RNA recognition motif-containing protein